MRRQKSRPISHLNSPGEEALLPTSDSQRCVFKCPRSVVVLG
jgi:hypothetical protein